MNFATVVLCWVFLLSGNAFVSGNNDSSIVFQESHIDNTCTTTNGERGECINVNNCSAFRKNPSQFSARSVCRWDRKTPIICCPIEDTVSYPMTCGVPSNRVRRAVDYEEDPPDDPEDVNLENPLIIGGMEARVAAWPWAAAVGKKEEDGSILWFCGAALVTSRYLLSAAHCYTSLKAEIIRLGDRNLDISEDDANAQNFNVKRVIVHPEYQYPVVYNDIVLIEIDRPAPYTDFIRPVCLPAPFSRDDFSGRQATAVGWGDVEFLGEKSPTLQEVSVTVLSNAECNTYYRRNNQFSSSSRFSNGFLRSQMCAGTPEGGKDACQGDSGGPLVRRASSSTGDYYEIIGIISVGIGCGYQYAPGIYTRVSEFHDWIQQNAGALPQPPAAGR